MPEETTALIPADVQALVREKVGALAASALAVRVVDANTHKAAGNNMLLLRGVRSEIVRIIKPGKQEASNVHKAWTAFEKSFLDEIDRADKHSEQEQIRYEGEQRKKAAAEQAERDRVAALAAKASEDAVLDAAVKAEAAGESDTAAAMVARAAAPALPAQGPAVAAVEETAGLKTRRSYAAALDPKTPKPLAKLLAAIAAGLAPADCVMLNQKFLDNVADSRKPGDGEEMYPGVVCVVTEYKQRVRGALGVLPTEGDM